MQHNNIYDRQFKLTILERKNIIYFLNTQSNRLRRKVGHLKLQYTTFKINNIRELSFRQWNDTTILRYFRIWTVWLTEIYSKQCWFRRSSTSATKRGKLAKTQLLHLKIFKRNLEFVVCNHIYVCLNFEITLEVTN